MVSANRAGGIVPVRPRPRSETVSRRTRPANVAAKGASGAGEEGSSSGGGGVPWGALRILLLSLLSLLDALPDHPQEKLPELDARV